MGAVTWQRMIELAHGGETQLLVWFLRGYEGDARGNMGRQHFDDIAQLIDKKIRQRPLSKCAPETLALVNSLQNNSRAFKVKIVVDRFRALERSSGVQLRGPARTKAIEKLIESIKPPRPSAADVKRRVKRGKRR